MGLAGLTMSVTADVLGFSCTQQSLGWTVNPKVQKKRTVFTQWQLHKKEIDKKPC